MHETESEFVEKMEEMPHETESEFGESGGEALHEIKSDFTGAITADRGRGGGERLSSQRRKRRCRKRKKYPTCVGYFYMKTDFDVVCFQKVSRPKPF